MEIIHFFTLLHKKSFNLLNNNYYQYMRFKIIFIVVFLILIAKTNDDNQTYVQKCDNIQYSPQLRNVFVLHSYDSLIIKIVFPFSFLACLATIGIYIKYQSTRQQPGDIILALSISQIFLLSSYLATVIYNIYNPIGDDVPADFVKFCYITGYATTLSFCTQFIYNLCFCGFFLMQIKNVLKNIKNMKYIIHMFCIVLLGIAGLIFYLTNSIGLSIFGVCGFKISSITPYLRSILIIVYLFCLSITLIYFKKYIPKNTNNLSSRKNFLKYYYRYNIAIPINLIIQTVFNLISAIKCTLNNSDTLQIFLTISNLLSLVTPFIIFGVIAWHPQVTSSVRNLYQRIFKKKRSQLSQSSIRAVEMQAIDNFRYLQNILETSKTSLIYTILVSLYMQDYESSQFFKHRNLFSWNYTDSIQFQVDEDLLKNVENISIKQFKLMNAIVTSYCPKAFKNLMNSDGFQNMKKHTNPRLNQNQILKCTQSSGGKSGQFFFFTYDNQIILKTLKKQQLNVIIQRMQEYAEHFQNNPYSLIVKIYGIYSIKNIANGQEYHIFMMRNISRCSSAYIHRIYDLKGSKFDRKVLKNYEQIQPRIRQTMKDIDFLNIQKKIKVEEELAHKIKQILTIDSNFLMKCKLIDYSLIIMKISIGEYLKDNNLTKEQFLNMQSNPHAYILNNQDENSAYALGIIDYLQTWNMRKKSEKLTKKIVYFTNSKEISAQSPQKYCLRFQNELINVIF